MECHVNLVDSLLLVTQLIRQLKNLTMPYIFDLYYQDDRSPPRKRSRNALDSDDEYDYRAHRETDNHNSQPHKVSTKPNVKMSKKNKKREAEREAYRNRSSKGNNAYGAGTSSVSGSGPIWTSITFTLEQNRNWSRVTRKGRTAKTKRRERKKKTKQTTSWSQ